MGFTTETIYPIGFSNRRTGFVDWHGFREDLRGKLQTDCKGTINGVSTDDLAEYYFGRRDLEASFRMENELQLARTILMKRGIILKNTRYRWHIVGDAGEAHGFLTNRSLRLVRAHSRLRVTGKVATDSYPELAETATVQAIGTMEKPIKELQEAVDKDLTEKANGD